MKKSNVIRTLATYEDAQNALRNQVGTAVLLSFQTLGKLSMTKADLSAMSNALMAEWLAVEEARKTGVETRVREGEVIFHARGKHEGKAERYVIMASANGDIYKKRTFTKG